MREQRRESGWIQRSLRLMLGCTKDLCCHLFLQLCWMLSLNFQDRVLGQLLYADDLVLVSEAIEGLRNEFIKWKEAFESKCLKVNLGKTKVMVSVGITKDGMSKSKVDPCGVYSLRVKANSAFCVQCGKWIHGRCAGVKRLTPMFCGNIACRKCEGNIGAAMEQEEKLCDEVETVGECTYLSDRVSAGGGCDCRSKMWVGGVWGVC